MAIPIEDLRNGVTRGNAMQQASNTRDMAAASEITMGFGSMASFELMQRAAKLLASSSLVPKEFQGDIANCVIALNMAQRIGSDPLMTMQNLYVVHGRPGWSAQFLIATFNQCGRFSSIRYEFFGSPGKDDYGCEAYATELSTGNEIRGSRITIALAKEEGWYSKSGSKWKTMAQQMLMYRSAAWLVRAYAPEIAMGLQTAEELHDTYDAQQDDTGTYNVVSEQEVVKAMGGEPEAETEAEAEAEPQAVDSNGEVFDPAVHIALDRVNKDGSWTKRPIRKNTEEAQDLRVSPLQKYVDLLKKAVDLDELDDAREQANGPDASLTAEQLVALDGFYDACEKKLKGSALIAAYNAEVDEFGGME